MPAEKATALVLRVIDFSETSCIVVLFSREYGKLRALAKGGRRPKGPFEAALDLLALCRVVFLRKSSDALDLLTEAKLLRRFRPSAGNLASLYAAYYVAELLGELTDDYDPHPQLFDLANATLGELASGRAVPQLVLRFEMAALRLLGHAPLFDCCVECGNQQPDAARVAFGVLDGGILCPTCRPGKRQVVGVSSDAIDALRAYAAEGESWQTAAVEKATTGELRAVINRYLTHLIGHKLKMHAFLGVISG
jgi:DNA repair protein RecO (recombination protein O)